MKHHKHTTLVQLGVAASCFALQLAACSGDHGPSDTGQESVSEEAETLPPSEEDLLDHTGYQQVTDPEILERERLAGEQLRRPLAARVSDDLVTKSLGDYSVDFNVQAIRGVAHRSAEFVTYDADGNVWLSNFLAGPHDLTPSGSSRYELPQMFGADHSAVATAAGVEGGPIYMWMKTEGIDDQGRLHGYVMAGSETHPYTKREPYPFYPPPGFRPKDLRGTGIDRESRCVYWWNDGDKLYRTVGTSNDTDKYSGPRFVENRTYSDGSIIPIKAMAIEWGRKKDVVVTWWLDEKVGIGSSLLLWQD